MRVHVQRDLAARVTKRFLNDLHIFAVGLQQRWVAVPKSVPADPVGDRRVVLQESVESQQHEFVVCTNREQLLNLA